MLVSFLLFAQLQTVLNAGAPAVHSGRDDGTAVRPPRVELPVAIDGVLDEPVWAQAVILSGFSQFSPVDGVPAHDSTEVLVWYSPTAIHFGVRAFEAHGAVHATLADRDRIFADDHIQILLGTFDDGRQATVFAVNPLGVQADGTLVEQGGTRAGSFSAEQVARESADLNPDFVFQSKGRVTTRGYEVEIRIPFKTLRYQSRPEQRWGLHILRRVQHSGYEDSWVPAKREAASFLAQSGHIEGLTGLRRAMSVCAVLVSFNWPSDSVRYKKIAKFVDQFFANFDTFLEAPRHPKWRDVNFAATLENWQRSALAQRWIDRAQPNTTDSASRSNFDAFLAQASNTRGAPISDAERADLFRAFLEWNRGQKSN